MKYWILTTEYPPSYGGGIGTYCSYAAKMLQENKWDVTVFVAAHDRSKDHIWYDQGVRIIEFATNRTNASEYMGWEAALSFEFAAAVKEYLETEGIPAIVESQEYAAISYYVLQYKHMGFPLFSELKVMLTLHAPAFLYYDYNRVPSYKLPYFWIGEMEKWCIKAADAVNSPSEFMRTAIQPYFDKGLNREISIIRYPFKNSSEAIQDNDDPRKNWFFFGKLTPQKGILPLLKAWDNLCNNGWNHILNVIGGGNHYFHPENMMMIDWVNEKYRNPIKNGKIKLLGSLPPEKWQSLLMEGAVIIIPSIGDNYPFTVIESLSMGQVVLTSMQGGQSELIRHGYNGFLFDHNIEGDLENKILEIQHLPLAKLNAVRENAISSVKQIHAFENVYPEKKNLIDTLLNKNTESDCFPFTRELKGPNNASDIKLNDELLSVVIPYHNMGEYVKEVLDSVFNSNYPHLEVIVVNDGSSDDYSKKRIVELQKSFGFKLVDQPNRGLSEARNTGAKVATGSFLAFVDADDKVDPTYFSKSISILKAKKNVSFVSSWVQYFENSQGIWPSFTPEPPYLYYYNMVCGGGIVYKKEAFISDGWNDKELEYGLEDYDSVISLVKNGWRGVVIPECLYNYRVRNKSMARKFTDEKILYSFRHIATKHKEAFAEYVDDLHALINANGPGYKRDNPSLDYGGVFSGKGRLMRKLATKIKQQPQLRKVALKIYNQMKVFIVW